MDIVFLDTETLGLDPIAPIWEFAAIRVRSGFPVETREFTIQHVPDGFLDQMAASSSKGAELAADYRARYQHVHALPELVAAMQIHEITAALLAEYGQLMTVPLSTCGAATELDYYGAVA